MSTVLHSKFLFLSVPEAAEALGVTDGRVRQLLLAGDLEGHKLGRRNWAIPPAAIERYQSHRRHPGRPKKNSN